MADIYVRVYAHMPRNLRHAYLFQFHNEVGQHQPLRIVMPLFSSHTLSEEKNCLENTDGYRGKCLAVESLELYPYPIEKLTGKKGNCESTPHTI